MCMGIFHWGGGRPKTFEEYMGREIFFFVQNSDLWMPPGTLNGYPALEKKSFSKGPFFASFGYQGRRGFSKYPCISTWWRMVVGHSIIRFFRNSEIRTSGNSFFYTIRKFELLVSQYSRIIRITNKNQSLFFRR